MKIQKNIITAKTLLTLLFVMISNTALAGHVTGNGGDFLRGTFINMGLAVIDFLESTTDGQKIISDASLDISSLKQSLDINIISVQETSLLDNGGVPVDSIGGPGQIVLDKAKWMEHFEKERDVYYLVFHEMLREISFNDDNYILSKKLNPFPSSRKISTRISPIFPLISSQRLDPFIDASKVGVGGSGCPIDINGTRSEFDFEKNTLDITFSKFRLSVDSNKGVDYKACAVAIPISIPNKFQIIITQVDFTSKFEAKAGTSLTLSAEAFTSGTSGKVEKIMTNIVEPSLVGRSLLRTNNSLITPCGSKGNTSAILRLNTSATMTGNDLSAADVDRLSISFKVQACK